ncbi:peptidase S41 [Marivirga lumbricoides]|uniref:Peptidase S41 n=1 Tax=Marivirga lumbricoides TaxID=1046115 RepID=A0ABQ1LXE0_9BACT|nr:peptidase S41 [Marivirga lumbricoides]
MKQFQLLLTLLLIINLLGCKEDDVNSETGSGSNEYVNNWIYDEMSLYYYWNNELPGKQNTGKDPGEYFRSLLSDKDRFSWIQPNFIELLNSLQGVNKEAGYEFILYLDSNRPNGVLGHISYVKKGSPASGNNLKRGDVFTEVNGTPLTIDNYLNLLDAISETHTLTLFRYKETSNRFESLGQQQFSTLEFAENPNYLDTVYTVNGKKIGYYVYNFFATGPTASNTQYLQEMDEIFQNFKGEGIQHLILDLRYNGGGAESATINLASLVGANISSENIFVKRDYNEGLKQAIIDQEGAASLNRKFIDKAANIGNSLQGPELTVLTSSRTASASELLINGLLPFMDIYIIGDTTVGKNVGSTTFYEEDNPENTWGMQPIITKSFNSLNNSDYDKGFIPNIALKDNDLVVKQLGDQEEFLLNAAINYITAGSPLARKESAKSFPSKSIYSSISNKRAFGIYNLDELKLLK